jgi:pantoate--beta-alanine ligase
MIILKKTADLIDYLNRYKQKDQQIGFVPTMGALHEGHVSLLKYARSADGVCVCSIFVNPTQFNDSADFEKYPVTIEEDIYKLETNGCDILFLPSTAEIYPEGTNEKKQYDLGYLETILEGEYRPGHFQGVCMVMEKLLSIVQPHHLYLGQKDYQQCMVIKRLTGLKGWNDLIHVIVCPIVRESDGLAMSSRNMRLNNEQRAKATALYEALIFLKQNFNKGAIADIKNEATEQLRARGFKPDYIEIANAETLKPINEWDARINCIGLAAAYLNDVRLIDNMMLSG